MPWHTVPGQSAVVQGQPQAVVYSGGMTIQWVAWALAQDVVRNLPSALAFYAGQQQLAAQGDGGAQQLLSYVSSYLQQIGH